MQQRIVVKVPMKKEKDRSKAMKVAVGVIGVSSVKICGENRDIVIVIGKEVDAITLTKSLIKKFGGATLVKVEPLVGNPLFNQDHEIQDQANSGNTYMAYEGSVLPNYYNNNYAQPMYQYNNPPPPTPYYYYSYDKRPVSDSDCSIM